MLTHPFFGKVCREDYLTKRMSPPVSFLNLKDLVFNEEEMEAENKKLMANILRSQSSSS